MPPLPASATDAPISTGVHSRGCRGTLSEPDPLSALCSKRQGFMSVLRRSSFMLQVAVSPSLPASDIGFQVPVLLFKRWSTFGGGGGRQARFHPTAKACRCSRSPTDNAERKPACLSGRLARLPPKDASPVKYIQPHAASGRSKHRAVRIAQACQKMRTHPASEHGSTGLPRPRRK